MGLGDCPIPTSSGFSMFWLSSLLSVRTGRSFDSKCGGTRGTRTQARSLVPSHVNMASSCLTSISLRDWKPPSFWQYGRSYACQVHVKCRSACLFLYLQRNMQKDTSMKWLEHTWTSRLLVIVLTLARFLLCQGVTTFASRLPLAIFALCFVIRWGSKVLGLCESKVHAVPQDAANIKERKSKNYMRLLSILWLNGPLLFGTILLSVLLHHLLVRQSNLVSIDCLLSLLLVSMLTAGCAVQLMLVPGQSETISVKPQTCKKTRILFSVLLVHDGSAEIDVVIVCHWAVVVFSCLLFFLLLLWMMIVMMMMMKKKKKKKMMMMITYYSNWWH